MHDTLFVHQDALDPGDLSRYAGDLGLDVDRFRRVLDDHSCAGRVREDFMSRVRGGVGGTPASFVDGDRCDGILDHVSPRDAIAGQLAGCADRTGDAG